MSFRCWSSVGANNNKPLSSPLVAAFLSTAAKTSSQAAKHQVTMTTSSSCRRLPINASAAQRKYISSKWANSSTNSNVKQQAAASHQKRFNSTFPNNNRNHKPRNKNINTFTTLSTLSNIVAAGTGTFASTLLALYLATVVETSAHEFLYEYFPHWYAEVHEEDLPTCLKSLEVARRATGLVELNRSRGVELGSADSLMGMDGWMEPNMMVRTVVDAELLAEAAFEKRQEAPDESNTTSTWQRRITEKRASIIEQEEQEFSRGVNMSSDSSLSSQSKLSESAKNGLMETKKIQEEAARKFQERLMSAAMTA